MRIAIVGAGGHAKVVADAILAIGSDRIVGFLDDDPLRNGGVCFNYPILGATDTWRSHSIDALIIGIGDNSKRKEHFDRLKMAGAELATIIHPRAVIGHQVTLGEGTVALANVVINCDARIGDNVILNTSCTVDHDCAIGSHSHLAPGVNLAGDVRLGEGVFAGVGAKFIPRVSVGAWSIIGAGAVVIRDIGDGAKVIGVPARQVKTNDQSAPTVL